MSSKKSGLSRRQFLGGVGATAATFLVVPRSVLGGAAVKPPSEKLNVAGIGVGGQGAGDIAQFGGENIVALCDVDQNRAADSLKKFPDAKTFKDFRKMFDAMEKNIDAVCIATPDHTHAVAVMASLKRGKHVYCEKPLAHSVWEVRQIMKAATANKCVTQLGNQGHSSDSIRLFCEWVWDGAIGKVHTIHSGCSAVNSGVDNLQKIRSETPAIPTNLDWDLWLGPAQQRPYHPAYAPYQWRGWVPFGNGTIGDWTCHVIDPVFWALDLGAPKTIQAEVKGWDFRTQGDAYPKGDIITYEFAATAKRGPIVLHWYSGTEKIPRPKDLEEDRKPVDTGAVVLGDKGTITYGSHGAGGVRIIPETAMKAYKLPEKTIPRARGHHQDWIRAIREGTKAGSDMPTYGGPLTEIAMLGVIAIKMSPRKLMWDTVNMKFTNCPEANAFLNPPYRAGWTL